MSTCELLLKIGSKQMHTRKRKHTCVASVSPDGMQAQRNCFCLTPVFCQASTVSVVLQFYRIFAHCFPFMSGIHKLFSSSELRSSMILLFEISFGSAKTSDRVHTAHSSEREGEKANVLLHATVGHLGCWAPTLDIRTYRRDNVDTSTYVPFLSSYPSLCHTPCLAHVAPAEGAVIHAGSLYVYMRVVCLLTLRSRCSEICMCFIF